MMTAPKMIQYFCELGYHSSECYLPVPVGAEVGFSKIKDTHAILARVPFNHNQYGSLRVSILLYYEKNYNS